MTIPNDGNLYVFVVNLDDGYDGGEEVSSLTYCNQSYCEYTPSNSSKEPGSQVAKQSIGFLSICSDRWSLGNLMRSRPC